MTDPFEQNFGIIFPFFFLALWLFVTTLLSFLSGWYKLAARFPDRNEEPLLKLSLQSGSMGLGVSMRGVLNISACPSGLRIGINRLFGPFARKFFVSWEDLHVTRRTILFSPSARLQFGTPQIGTLTISGHAANRLARAAQGKWPEREPLPDEPAASTFRRLFFYWAAITCLAAIFFSGVLFSDVRTGTTHPAIIVAIAFPAVVFGVAFLIRYFRERA